MYKPRLGAQTRYFSLIPSHQLVLQRSAALSLNIFPSPPINLTYRSLPVTVNFERRRCPSFGKSGSFSPGDPKLQRRGVNLHLNNSCHMPTYLQTLELGNYYSVWWPHRARSPGWSRQASNGTFTVYPNGQNLFIRLDATRSAIMLLFSIGMLSRFGS